MEIHYINIIITSKAHINILSDNSCGAWLQKSIPIIEKSMEGGSCHRSQLVVECPNNQSIHPRLKHTNTNNMYQSIIGISSKSDEAGQIILAQHYLRHISSRYQETLHLARNQSPSHHVQIFILHPLHHNTVLIKLRATRNT